jgi:hypothetical protein
MIELSSSEEDDKRVPTPLYTPRTPGFVVGYLESN